jgi:peptidoglycan hydrolase CwlO-like protein
MKKLAYITLGVLIGVALTVSVGAYAASTGFVGKKITSEVPIILNGKQVADRGAVVDGKTLLPVRTLAGLIGVNVQFSGGKVVLTKSEESPSTTSPGTTTPAPTTNPSPVTPSPSPSPATPITGEGDKLKAEIANIDAQLWNLTSQLNNIRNQVAALRAKGINSSNPQEIQSQINDLESQGRRLVEQIDSLEQQKAALESQLQALQ